jgi:hypothetical protein
MWLLDYNFGIPEEYKKGDPHLKTVWIYRIKNKE